MAPIQFETTLSPAAEVTGPIERGLHEFNLNVLGEEVIYNYAKIAITARDEQGEVVGGIIGQLIWGWLHIDTLWVTGQQRGQEIGSHLLAALEQEARQRGVTQAVLETTSFQARDFYRKYGFEVVGQIDGKPKGHTWYYLKKE